MILACSHGTLGDITARHHLGMTADVSDEADILQKTETALSRVSALDFQYDKKAESYRNQLNPAHFLETYKKIYES